MEKSDSSLTPEKRLLQLIEGGSQTEGPEPAKEAKPNPFVGAARYLSPQGMMTLLAEIRESWSNLVTNRKDFVNLAGVNKVVKFFTVILAVGLAINLFMDLRMVQTYDTSNFDIPERKVADIEMSERKIFDTDLVHEADNIKVFIPYDKRYDKEDDEETPDGTSLKLVEMLQDWKLAGLSISPDDPSRSYCMIENVSKASTSFLKVGDSIQGFKVHEINKDGIVLKFNQETLELR